MLRELMPKGLYGRFLILIMAPIVMLWALMIYGFLGKPSDDLTRRLADGITGEVAFLVAAYERFPDPDAAATLNKLAYVDHGFFVSFEHESALPPPNDLGAVDTMELARLLTEKFGRRSSVSVNEDRRFVDIYVEVADGQLHIAVPRVRLRASSTTDLVYWFFGLPIVLGAIAFLFLRNQVKPMHQLAQAAENFGKGIDDPAFKPSGAREVRRAGLAFQVMRERVRRHMEQRTAMLAAVSHDLRTPLTRLKLELAMLGGKPEVEDMMADVNEMERMVGEYLAFTRGEGTDEPTRQDLAPIIDEVAEAARRRGAALTVEMERPLDVAIRRDAVKRCLTNLIDNAGRYGKKIQLTAARRSRSVEIAVDDDGPGIPDDKIEDAFRPFVRLDAARDPNRGGVGLGLAIARDIARGHGGDVLLARSPMGGLRALVRLPV